MAASQLVRIPGEDTAAMLIARLATTVLDLNAQLAEIDKLIADRSGPPPTPRSSPA